MLAASLLAALFAADPPVSASALEWEVPLGCPGAAWLTDRIEAYLGRPIAADELDATIGGSVRSGADGRFELELDIGDTRRHRLADHDCRRLTDTAASLLAIAIDPLALGDPLVPLEQAEPPILVVRPQPPIASEPESSIEPPRAGPEPVPWELVPLTADDEVDEPDRPERLRSDRLRGVLAADAGLALGLFPNLAPQVHGRIGLELHEPDARVGLRVELDGGAALAGRFRASDGRELGGDLIAWDLALRPCAVPRWGRVDLRTCASVGAGQLRGRGIGVVDPQQVAQPWVWAGADVGVAVALRRRDARPRIGAALFLDVGGGLNLLRPNFVVLDANGGPNVAYVMPLGSGRGRLGIELKFF